MAAIKEAPKDPAVLLAASQWYLGQNDLERAKAIAEDALKLDTKSLEEVLANEPMFATRPDAVDLLAKLKKDAP